MALGVEAIPNQAAPKGQRKVIDRPVMAFAVAVAK
jgi:hypothetical protein